VSSNRGVVYLGPSKVNARNIDFPIFRNPAGKPIKSRCDSQGRLNEYLRLRPAYGTRPRHGLIGMVLGHEITGEIIEIGRDVEYLKVGDLVSVPFNVACGRCRWPRPSPKPA